MSTFLKFSKLVESFEHLEKTSSRNGMIKILENLFKKATEANIDVICYFALGNIVAGYKDIKIGMGDEMIKTSITFADNLDKEDI